MLLPNAQKYYGDILMSNEFKMVLIESLSTILICKVCNQEHEKFGMVDGVCRGCVRVKTIKENIQ
jgi:hypothetical protein